MRRKLSSQTEEKMPQPEDYLHLTEAELREGAGKTKDTKIKSIAKYPHPLSSKQKYCLAKWIAENNPQLID